MIKEPGDSPEEPSFREFLQICDPLLLMLLGEYVSRLINGEEEPELRSMRLLISLESMERLRRKGAREEIVRAFEELPSLFEEILSRYTKLRNSAELEPEEEAV